MRFRIVFLSSLLLAACGGIPPVANDTAPPASSASSSSSEQSERSSEPATIAFSDALLDATFTSAKLGITLRYPSTWYDADCETKLPVEAVEREGSVDFMLKQVVDTRCTPVPANRAQEFGMSDLIATVYAERASTEEGVRHFIDRVFPHDCVIDERSDDRLFLKSKNPPKDAPDFDCGESILWNKDAGVVYFSSLGSKNGGGWKWMSEKGITQSGSVSFGYDFYIMDTITFLKS